MVQDEVVMSYLMDFRLNSNLAAALCNASEFVYEKYNMEPPWSSMNIMETEFSIVFHHDANDSFLPLVQVEFLDEPHALFFILRWS